jgi:hypothetical protein
MISQLIAANVTVAKFAICERVLSCSVMASSDCLFFCHFLLKDAYNSYVPPARWLILFTHTCKGAVCFLCFPC